MKKVKQTNNRLLYSLIALGILSIFAVGVYAATYGTSGAGHPYTEISTCGANQVLKMNAAGTAWECGDISVSTNISIKRTTATHNGKFAESGQYQGYAAINQWIQSNGCEGYHVCTSHELFLGLQKGSGFLVSEAWYNSETISDGTSTYYQYATIPNCYGWTHNGDAVYGQIVRDVRIFTPWPCNQNKYVACCK